MTDFHCEVYECPHGRTGDWSFSVPDRHWELHTLTTCGFILTLERLGNCGTGLVSLCLTHTESEEDVLCEVVPDNAPAIKAGFLDIFHSLRRRPDLVFKPDDYVTYIPHHANGSLSHPDRECGVVGQDFPSESSLVPVRFADDAYVSHCEPYTLYKEPA